MGIDHGYDQYLFHHATAAAVGSRPGAPRTTPLLSVVLAFLLMASVAAGEALPVPCRLLVVEKGSGWPVPLVELTTTAHVRYVTDNAGVVAFDQPELMGQEVWLEIRSPGYGVGKDGFGNRGRRITPLPGKTITIEIERQVLAKRIGRLTGGGLFSESQRFGDHADWHESGIIGSDSVQFVASGGKLLWLWGDSGIPSYPLGIFHSSGARSDHPATDALIPPLKLPLDYFRDAKGKPRGIAPLTGEGPTWVFGMLAMKDAVGRERVGGYYSKIKGMLDAYETGLVVWDDAKEEFVRHLVVWEKSSGKPVPKGVPDGQASTWRDAAGKAWFHFGSPFPTMRCEATFAAWSDPARWETVTPQREVASPDGGKVTPHTGVIGFHPWRQRWVTVFMQRHGKPSALGEIWYAEADQPTGPWGTAVKILSHENYTFYNPCLHLDWTPAGKPWLYFEGTYTTLFTDNQAPTPRYDYNQILYRLDLDDPGLRPAQP